MKVGELFKDSVLYPFKDLKKLFVLILLYLGSFLVVPVVLVMGYMFRIIEFTLEGKETLPSFNNTKELLVNGLKFWVVNAVYSIPSILILLTLLSNDGNPLNVLNIISNPIYNIINTFVGFLVNIIAVLGVANMVYKNSLIEAFNFKKIFQLIREIGYKEYLTYIIIYNLIVLLLTIPLILLTFESLKLGESTLILLTYILIPFTVYIMVFGARIKGLIYLKNRRNNTKLSI